MQQLLEVVPPQSFNDKEDSLNSSSQTFDTEPNEFLRKNTKI